MLLAELSGLEIGATICAIVFGALTIVIALISIFRKNDTTISTQPLIIAMQKEFAGKHEFDAHVAANGAAHEAIFSKIGGVERGGNNKISVEIMAVHSRINGLEKSVGGLESLTQAQNAQLTSMDHKMDQMPSRIIADLRNAKGLL